MTCNFFLAKYKKQGDCEDHNYAGNYSDVEKKIKTSFIARIFHRFRVISQDFKHWSSGGYTFVNP